MSEIRNKSENDISYEIRGAIFDVYKELGPGLLESVYEAALIYELHNRGLQVDSQVPVPIKYKGELLNVGYRLDLLVENSVIVELKSVTELENIHYKQLLTYLRLTSHKLGILVNFNCENILCNIKRVVNHL